MGASESKDSSTITASSTAEDVARIHTEKVGADLTGRVFIVTGITHGIGRETARVLAKYNATLVVGNRNNELASEVIAELKTETKNDNIHHFHLDLASFASVQKFAQEFLNMDLPLHGLVNNAGVATKDFSETEDGMDVMYQVNYLGPFYLTHLLTDKLVSSAPSRVVNVSSGAHAWAKEEFFPDNLPMTKTNWGSNQAYFCAKLSQVLHAEHLNEQLRERGVTAYSLHPGFIYTNIYKYAGWIDSIIKVVNYTGLTKSIEVGASTQMFCLLTDTALEHSGKFFDNNAVQTNEKSVHALASNTDVQQQVWDASMRLVNDVLAKQGEVNKASDDGAQ